MTFERDCYSILGITPDATSQQIRDAYRMRAQITHPDRFDRELQPELWQRANDMLAEINNAYRILGDPSARATYDELRTRHDRTQPPNKPQNNSTSNNAQIRSGHVHFKDISKSAQEAITKRQRTKNVDQFKIQTRADLTPRSAQLLIGISIAWLWFLWSVSDNFAWTPGHFAIYAILTIVAAIAIAFSIIGLIKWHSTTLKSFFYITPLYLIKTSDNLIWYWPIWSLENVSATQRPRDSYDTEPSFNVALRFADQQLTFTATRKQAEALSYFIDKFRTQLSEAIASRNDGYFHDRDEFRDAPETQVIVKEPIPAGIKFAAIATPVSIAALVFFMAASLNAEFERNNWFKHETKTERSDPRQNLTPTRSTSIASRPATDHTTPVRESARFKISEQSLPLNGMTQRFSDDDPIAPFEINAGRGSHHLVKLVDLSSKRTICTAFVRENSQATIQVPIGTYIVRYASGSTWYGDEYLFGPETTYTEADTNFKFEIVGNQVSGYSITLYKMQDGNLRMHDIEAAEF